MGWFERIETYVTAALRVILVAVGALTILALAGLLVWTAWALIVPNNVDHREFLTAPSYAEFRNELLPTPGTAPSSPGNPQASSQKAGGSQQVRSPYIDQLSSVTSTLDKQYNIAGRQEKKFSATVPASQLEQELIDQGLASRFNLEEVVDDYLAALQELANEIADDAVLSRIADTNSRTSIILNAINKFHDEYVLRLDNSYGFASTLTAEQNAAETLTLTFLMWSLSAGFTIFLMAALILAVFRIESHLRNRTESKEVSLE